MKRTPYTKKDFQWTQWSAKDIQALPAKIIAEKKARLAVIKKVLPGQRNFENTVYALEASDNGLTDTILKIDLLQNVSPEKAVRESAQKAVQSVEKQLIRIERDPKIWQALKDYEQGAWRTERATLKKDDQKLFRDMFLVYKRMGFDLSAEKQKRLKEIEERLAKISNMFRQNINSHQDHILVSPEEARGLSERFLSGLKRDKQGNYIVTLAYPDYHPFMELAQSEKKREELNNKFFQRGGQKNMLVLNEMLSLRNERAALLGYAHHADYQTELRMAKSGKATLRFEKSLLKKVAQSGKHDLDELRDLKRMVTKNPHAELFSHDIAYYGNELQKQRFHFEGEEVRAYFPLARVIEGTFNIYGTLFGITFEKIKGFPLWHKDVELYAIKDSKNEILSCFALDLYPREGKFGHAAVFVIISGRTTAFPSDRYIAPFVTMVTNFPKPSSKHPSLLSHSEVETFLHEFGHVMHSTLTNARHASQAGHNVAWDFVEAPSQMLEHWAWDKKPLSLLSAHHQTGKPIPSSLLKNLLKSKEHLLRYTTLRQLILGIFDLDLHSTANPPEPAKLYRDMIKKYTGINMSPDAIFPAGFGHLDGYDAGYYGYLWSNVYAADMFTRFAKEGILNKKTGADYKKWILEKGGSEDELGLVKGFLGRTPNDEAFLKEIGVDK